MQSRIDNEREKPYISAAARRSIVPASLQHRTTEIQVKKMSDQCEIIAEMTVLQ